MKKLYIILFTLQFCICSCAGQKVIIDRNNNGVRRISTSSTTIYFAQYFDLYLDRFSDGQKVEYYLRGQSSHGNKYHHIPENGKILIRLMNDEIIELTSCYSELVKVSDTARVPIAYYPITESQLLSLFTGIKKIRVELLTLNEDDETVFTEYVDKEYKKDKLGRVIKEMYDAISVLLSNEKAAASKDIHDGF